MHRDFSTAQQLEIYLDVDEAHVEVVDADEKNGEEGGASMG